MKRVSLLTSRYRLRSEDVESVVKSLSYVKHSCYREEAFAPPAETMSSWGDSKEWFVWMQVISRSETSTLVDLRMTMSVRALSIIASVLLPFAAMSLVLCVRIAKGVSQAWSTTGVHPVAACAILLIVVISSIPLAVLAVLIVRTTSQWRRARRTFDAVALSDLLDS